MKSIHQLQKANLELRRRSTEPKRTEYYRQLQAELGRQDSMIEALQHYAGKSAAVEIAAIAEEEYRAAAEGHTVCAECRAVEGDRDAVLFEADDGRAYCRNCYARRFWVSPPETSRVQPGSHRLRTRQDLEAALTNVKREVGSAAASRQRLLKAIAEHVSRHGLPASLEQAAMVSVDTAGEEAMAALGTVWKEQEERAKELGCHMETLKEHCAAKEQYFVEHRIRLKGQLQRTEQDEEELRSMIEELPQQLSVKQGLLRDVHSEAEQASAKAAFAQRKHHSELRRRFGKLSEEVAEKASWFESEEEQCGKTLAALEEAEGGLQNELDELERRRPRELKESLERRRCELQARFDAEADARAEEVQARKAEVNRMRTEVEALEEESDECRAAVAGARREASEMNAALVEVRSESVGHEEHMQRLAVRQSERPPFQKEEELWRGRLRMVEEERSKIEAEAAQEEAAARRTWERWEQDAVEDERKAQEVLVRLGRARRKLRELREEHREQTDRSAGEVQAERAKLKELHEAGGGDRVDGSVPLPTKLLFSDTRRRQARFAASVHQPQEVAAFGCRRATSSASHAGAHGEPTAEERGLPDSSDRKSVV